MSKRQSEKEEDIGMKRSHVLALGLLTALIITLSSGCYGPANYGRGNSINYRYGSYSGADSVYIAPIRRQPIPVVYNQSFRRHSGYSLVDFVPVRSNPSNSGVGPYSKNQAKELDRDTSPEFDYGGGGAGAAGGGGGAAGGGGG